MAQRPVFVAVDFVPYASAWNVEFDYAPGFADVQQRKNIAAIHEGFARRYPDRRVLEISSKSTQEGGRELSAFSLPKFVASLGRSVPVECCYQAAKVFEKTGPHADLLTASPRDAKRDPRLRSGGRIVAFEFEGTRYPTMPRTAFYDYLYVQALLENPGLASTVLAYDAFTDIAFNPQRSENCQARAAALFVGAHRAGRADDLRAFGDFLTLYGLARRAS